MSYTRTLKETVTTPLVSIKGAAIKNGGLTFVFTGTKTGSRVEGWRELIKKGLPASSTYQLDMTKLVKGRPESHFGSMRSRTWPYETYTYTTEGYPAIQWMSSTVNHLGVASVKARSVALSKLYKKLESDRSEMNAYASIAEFGDVLRQFGRPFGSLVDAFLRHENRLIFEKRRLVGSPSWKKEQYARIAANTWLETSFGLLPLISDAESLAKSFGRWEYELSDSPKLRDRMRTRAEESASSAAGPYRWNGYEMSFDGIVKTTTVARAQYVVGLSGEVRADFGSNARLLEILGFEDRNIPMAVWEATPWSWLVDYGTNVQQIMQAAATITSRVKWIVLSETLQTTVHAAPIVTPGHNSNSYELLDFQSDYPLRVEDRGVKMIRTTLNRTLPSTLGMPPLYFKSPLGDMKKMANLLALAVSRSKDRTTWLS
jgi:hypothetical protein